MPLKYRNIKSKECVALSGVQAVKCFRYLSRTISIVCLINCDEPNWLLFVSLHTFLLYTTMIEFDAFREPIMN